MPCGFLNQLCLWGCGLYGDLRMDNGIEPFPRFRLDDLRRHEDLGSEVVFDESVNIVQGFGQLTGEFFHVPAQVTGSGSFHVHVEEARMIDEP